MLGTIVLPKNISRTCWFLLFVFLLLVATKSQGNIWAASINLGTVNLVRGLPQGGIQIALPTQMHRPIQQDAQLDLDALSSAKDFFSYTSERNDQSRVGSYMGLVELATGQDSRATVLFKEHLQKYPHDWRAWSWYGGALWASGDKSQAIAAWRRAGFAPAITSYAGILQAGGNTGLAEDAYRLALRVDPCLAQAYSGLTGIYWAAGRQEDYISVLRLALKCDLKQSGLNEYYRGQLALATGHPSHAVKYLKQAIATLPSNSYSYVPMYLAKALEQIGDWPGAVQAYELAIQRTGNTWLYVSLARVYERLGEIESAKEQLRLALEKNPAFPQAHETLGRILLSQHEWDEAIVHLQTAKESHPQDISIRHLLAQTYIRSGNIDAACSEYKAILKYVPKDSEAQRFLAERKCVH